jgi:hypothetical protein
VARRESRLVFFLPLPVSSPSPEEQYGISYTTTTAHLVLSLVKGGWLGSRLVFFLPLPVSSPSPEECSTVYPTLPPQLTLFSAW